MRLHPKGEAIEKPPVQRMLHEPYTDATSRSDGPRLHSSNVRLLRNSPVVPKGS